MTRQREKTRKAVSGWLQACEDMEWASDSDELQQKFAGEFVVVHDKTVIAHAPDRREALRQAIRAGYRRGELVVVPFLAPHMETAPDSV